MIEALSIQRLDQVELGLQRAAQKHGGSLLSAVRVSPDAVTFTLCLSRLQAPLLAADLRFAAVLPVRVAACSHGSAVALQSVPPREFCRLLHRPDAEPLARELEDVVREIIAEATARPVHSPQEHQPTEDQVNMRATLAQRIDCHGVKLEELAGVGVHDAQGG